ncbi:MAG: hypothetical protein IJQ66_04205, partial [Clostridia bacterium]|nr:hypothetical protein [Clostridia bacterium]
ARTSDPDGEKLKNGKITLWFREFLRNRDKAKPDVHPSHDGQNKRGKDSVARKRGRATPMGKRK